MKLIVLAYRLMMNKKRYVNLYRFLINHETIKQTALRMFEVHRFRRKQVFYPFETV